MQKVLNIRTWAQVKILDKDKDIVLKYYWDKSKRLWNSTRVKVIW